MKGGLLIYLTSWFRLGAPSEMPVVLLNTKSTPRISVQLAPYYPCIFVQLYENLKLTY